MLQGSVFGLLKFIAYIEDNCVDDAHRWCASKRLQLNPSKTEIIWFGTNANLKKLQSIDLSLNFGADTITGDVPDLGVILDNELTMAKHIAKIASVCYYHLSLLKQVRLIISPEIAARFMSAYVITGWTIATRSWRVYIKASIMPLQCVQNVAARLIKLLGPRDISSTICDLHWFPVKHRITYKLCVITHAANNH